MTARAIRIGAVALAALLALAIAAVLGFALVPAVRDAILAAALPRIDAALPGRIEVAAHRWPSLGRLELDRILWTDGPDTLVALERLVLDADLGALRSRDLRVRELEVLGISGDLPALGARFASREGGEEAPRPARKRRAFPREGALPSLPSVAVERVRVEARDLAVGPALRVQKAALTGRAELRAGREPAIDAAVRATADGWEVALDAATPAADALSASATVAHDGVELARLVVAVRQGPDGADPRDAELGGTLRLRNTADLASAAGLAERLAAFPHLEGVEIAFHGTTAARPSRRARFEITVEPNAWLEGVFARGAWEDGALAVDTLSIGLPDVRATAAGRWTGRSLDAKARVSVTGTRALAVFAPGARGPDRIALELRAAAEGELPRPRLDLDLEGSAALGALELERLAVRASVQETGPARIDVEAVARGLRADVAAEVEPGPWRARLSPLRIVGAAAPAQPPGPLRGEIVVDPAKRTLSADRVAIAGALGDLALSARFGADRRGTFEIAWSCPEAPPLDRLGLARADLRDSLRASWAADGVPFLEIAGEAAPSGEGVRVDASGRFSLPGPRAFAPLLPAGAQVGDLGSVRGAFEGFVDSGERAFDARLDLEDTAWLPAGRIAVRGAGGRVDVDTLALAVEGVRIEGAGAADEDSVRFEGSVAVEDLAFARRILAVGADELDAAFRAHILLSGTRKEPQAHATLEGRGRFREHEVRDVTGNARWHAGRLEADLALAASLAGGRVLLDRVAAGFESLGEALWPARTRLEIDGHAGTLRQTVTVARDSTWRADVEELAVGWDGRSLRNDGVATIVADPGRGAFSVDGLRLVGDLGRIVATARVGKDSIRGEAHVACALPGKPEIVTLPEWLWPDSLVVDVAVADSAVAATFQVTEGGATVVGGEIRAPASSSLVGGRIALADGPMTGHVEVDGFRVPAPAEADARSFAVDGRIDIGGRTSAPHGEGEFTVSFPEWPLLDRHALVVRASSDSGAIAAVLSGTDDRGVERMRGTARIPARLSIVPPSFERPAAEPLRAELHAAGADLRRLGPLLPDGMDLGGVLDLDFVAEGSPAELTLDGRVHAKGVAVTAADGSRVQGDVSIAVAGTTARPAIDGEVRVVQGVIQIPETSKTLHPSDGQAKLWESDWKPRADSLAAPAAPPDTTVAIPADLDVRVIVPGQVWIRGRNMMFELEGTLAVAQRGASPTVTGELRAVQGRMTFVGRRFTVSRGEVLFYGDDELDPSLDVALRCDLGGKTFWIEVTGTARKPKLALRSEPEEMSEGDIISYLLFGSSMGDLDGGQEELMGRLAGAYASAELNERLSGSGVDVVSVDTGDKERGSSLTVGKYVSQKMLVSYEQALDDVAESLLSVEYLLTQRFRVSTLYGDTQSGVELRFDNDY